MTQQECDVCHGTGKEIKEKCTTCHGAGHVRKKHAVQVKVPAGVENGNQMRLQGQGEAGYGFRAAVLPYLLAQDERALAQTLQSSLPTPAQQRADAPAYSAQMLALFGLGWAEGRYRFAADGQLRPRWGEVIGRG